MKRTVWIPIVLAASAAAFVMGTSRFGIEAKSGVAQARPSAALDVPKFRVDPAWPKVPKQWMLGQVAGLAVKGAEQILKREVNAAAHADLLNQLKTEL